MDEVLDDRLTAGLAELERLGCREAVLDILMLIVVEVVVDFVEAILAVPVLVVLTDFDSFEVAEVV